MKDKNIYENLKDVFNKLTGEVTLVIKESTHPDQYKLIEFLEDIKNTTNKVILKFEKSNTSPLESRAPEFYLETKKSKKCVSFSGIPTGHEFSSLILAILNADGKGKFPDEVIIERIKCIKGPIHLKTFISLTCENCPDVVWALNQMALIHDDFHHQMIDGAYFQDEISRLKIQGVPSVLSMTDEKLIYSGKLNLLNLIESLEQYYGINKTPGAEGEHLFVKKIENKLDLGKYDVVVIGAGPSGSSSAIYSCRKGLKTAIIGEKPGGQIQETKGIENLIGTKYIEGPALAQQLNIHLSQYPVDIFEYRRVSKIENKGNFEKIIYMTSGEYVFARAIIIATGAKWRELNVSGEKEYLGKGVAFCPHCDGPYFKGKKVVVVGGGNSGVEAAIDLSSIVNEVVLIEFAGKLKSDKVLVEKLESIRNVSVIANTQIKEIQGDGNEVKNIVCEDRIKKLNFTLNTNGVFVQIGLLPNTQFVKDVLRTNERGEIVVDQKGRTSVSGIYAAGDVTDIPFKQIIIAMGEGAKVALSVFEDLIFEK